MQNNPTAQTGNYYMYVLPPVLPPILKGFSYPGITGRQFKKSHFGVYFMLQKLNK